MHGESQANRLASLMQKHQNIPAYELALPLVTVQSSALDSINTDDILMLKQKRFECILLNNDTIVAETILIKEHNRYVMEVMALHKRKLGKTQRKAHEILKLSFGKVYSRSLEIGQKIELAQIDLYSVILLHINKKIAEASLIEVDGEIALKIDKVIK